MWKGMRGGKLIFNEGTLIKNYNLPVEKPKIQIREYQIYDADLRNKLKALLLGQRISSTLKEERPPENLWNEVEKSVDSEDVPRPKPTKEVEVVEKPKVTRRRIREKRETPKEEIPQETNTKYRDLLNEVLSMGEAQVLMHVIKENKELFLEYSKGKVEKDKVLKEGRLIILKAKGVPEEIARKLLGE